MTHEVEFLDGQLKSLGFREEHWLDDDTILSKYHLEEEGLTIFVTCRYVVKDGQYAFDSQEIEIKSISGSKSFAKVSHLKGLKDLVDYLKNIWLITYGSKEQAHKEMATSSSHGFSVN